MALACAGPMKLLAILRPPADGDVAAAAASKALEELHTGWDLYRSGFVREIYSPDGGLGAVLIVEAGSAQEAQERLLALPLVAAGIMEMELIALHPFWAAEMLFEGGVPRV